MPDHSSKSKIISAEMKRLKAKIKPVPKAQKGNSLGVIAHRIKTARLAMGLTQRELGLKIGLSEDVASARINRYEKMAMAPKLATIEKIAQALDIDSSVLYLENDTEAMFMLFVSELSNTGRAQAAQILVQSLQSKGIAADHALIKFAATAQPLLKAPPRRGRKL